MGVRRLPKHHNFDRVYVFEFVLLDDVGHVMEWSPHLDLVRGHLLERGVDPRVP
jgi:hypothetical protein